jgi:hypothetical protein
MTTSGIFRDQSDCLLNKNIRVLKKNKRAKKLLMHVIF